LKKSLHMIIVLVIVGAVSGTTLVSMYNYAQPLIEENKKAAVKNAIYKVLPETEAYEVIAVNDRQVYKAKDDAGRVIGYAFVAEGSGYQGKISIMVGMDSKLKTVKGIDILESVETPGLGAKIQEKPFKDQFKNKSALPEITYVKNKAADGPNEIQAITGATVSSSSVVRILNKEIAGLRKALLPEGENTYDETQAVTGATKSSGSKK